ncbi:MAG: hypothetical protein ABJF10_03720 [Chthoniobacter sp.]|uniref:hypothetical protein n=1 Tax=Chthoniobacter sp. TaxID=2510640 RepID=UPI0032A1FB92
MKLLSQSPEAVALILGLSASEASTLLQERRLAELREREELQRRTARGGLGARNRTRLMRG